MTVPSLDDRALDALLSGAPAAQSGLDWLVPFVDGLDSVSRGPAPVAQPALALLLSEGFTPTHGVLAAPAAPRPKRRLARLGLAAKAGFALALAVASTTAAGAAGALPGPAQHVVARVVAAATPFTFPDQAADKAGFGGTVSRDATGASDGVPGVDGTAVSGAARDKGAGETPAVPGAGAGSTGLDRANETPAAGHVPTSVPGANGRPTTTRAPSPRGLTTANSTPAAGKVPTSVPADTRPTPPSAGGQGANGQGTAATTPAAGKVPGGPPGRS